MEQSYRHISYFFIAVLIFIVYAFSPTYFGIIPNFPVTITMLTHFHATTALLWLLMLIVQPILIRRQQLVWHRRIGKTSYVLVPMVVIGLFAIISQLQMREKSLPIFAANLLDVPIFILFYSLAIYYRKKTAYHLRFILLTVVPLIGPAAARIPFEALILIIAIFFGGLIFERFHNKVYKPYLIGLGLYVSNLVIVAYLFIGNQALLEKIWGMFWG